MGIRAGQLRHRVTIEQHISGGRDDNGFDLPLAWVYYAKIWAKVTPLSTKDLLSAQAAQSEITARMKVRYRTDIDTNMRVIWKDRIFAIDGQGLDDSDTGMEHTTFNLSGGVEKFKSHNSELGDILELNRTDRLFDSVEKLVNEDLPETNGR